MPAYCLHSVKKILSCATFNLKTVYRSFVRRTSIVSHLRLMHDSNFYSASLSADSLSTTINPSCTIIDWRALKVMKINVNLFSPR